jgi:hypothetical protein
MFNNRVSQILFSLSILSVPFAIANNALAGDWITAENAHQYCDVRNVNDIQNANGFHNQGQVIQQSITEDSISQQQTQASNSGWATQSIGSIEERNCSALLQAEIHRYTVNQQIKNQRYMYDTNMRQQLLGNMLSW